MATAGEKEIKRHWPIESGLTARTQKQEGRQTNLIPERGSFIPDRLKVGL